MRFTQFQAKLQLPCYRCWKVLQQQLSGKLYLMLHEKKQFCFPWAHRFFQDPLAILSIHSLLPPYHSKKYTNKATPTSSPPDIWTMWVWLVFPSHTIWLPSLSLLVPTKTWYTAHSSKCLDTFLQNTTVQKGARAPLRKMKEKCHLHGFLQITFTAPPACSKSPLLPPGQKKEKPQKLIKTENKPFRSHSFEHILVFLSKTHHSTINHKSP